MKRFYLARPPTSDYPKSQSDRLVISRALDDCNIPHYFHFGEGKVFMENKLVPTSLASCSERLGPEQIQAPCPQEDSGPLKPSLTLLGCCYV